VVRRRFAQRHRHAVSTSATKSLGAVMIIVHDFSTLPD
jgi:hypothetical protein